MERGCITIKIAVINADYMSACVEKAVENYSEQCTFDVFKCNTSIEVEQCFLNNKDRVDGFIVNGILTTTRVRKAFPDYPKPIVCLNIDYISIYQSFISLLIENRNLDLNRVYVDFLAKSKCTDLQEIIKQNRIIDEVKKYLEHITSLEINEISTEKENLINEILSLWKSKKIDMVLTRYSTIISALEQNNIPYMFLYPSDEYIDTVVQSAIDKVKVYNLQGKSIAVIDAVPLITPGDNEVDIALKKAKLNKALSIFSKRYCFDFLIKDNIEGFEILTTSDIVKKITIDFSECTLSEFLQAEVKEKFFIGYGIAPDLTVARVNAQSALNQAKRHGSGVSYAIKENGQMIGPLTKLNGLVLSEFSPKMLEEQAKSAGVSSITLQRILSVLKNLGTETITARILAEKMDITVRSSSRFLAKLEQAGQAVPIGKKQSKTRGRPETEYQIKY
ncbi:MAG: hypothetical protein RR827_05305 [Oscillospiraceae bacterium]